MPVSRPHRVLATVAILAAGALLALTAQQIAWPQRDGWLALGEVFAPWLFLPLLLAVPLAFGRGMGALRIALLACAVVFAVRFVPWPRAVSAAAPPGATRVRVMTWNVREGGRRADVDALLGSRPADIVSVDEADWRWMDTDPVLRAAYPYEHAVRGDPVASVVLFSRYPITTAGMLDTPPGVWDPIRAIWADVTLPAGQDLLVVAAHPPPAERCRGPCPSLDVYDARARDARLASVRAFVAPALAAGRPVIIAGDLNTTPREPGYADVTRGLHDAFAEVGQGVGATWRTALLNDTLPPLLRIDYLLSSPNVQPLGAAVDCTPRGSDHCLVTGDFAVPP